MTSLINREEYQYLNLMAEVMDRGQRRETRSGPVRSLFGAQMRFDVAGSFPLLTTKKVHLKSIIIELLWFLRGETNIAFLEENGVSIWREWADENGDLGPVYGSQWRSWDKGDGTSVDQITNLIEGLKRDPYSRRHMVSAWNPGVVDQMALPPCHCLFQFYVRDTPQGARLDCQLYQRSADIFLGVPFNIASYSLLTMMVAEVVGLMPGEFVHSFGDVHLYENHMDQAKTQLERIPDIFPSMIIAKRDSVFDYQLGDFTLVGYRPSPAIKAPVSK